MKNVLFCSIMRDKEPMLKYFLTQAISSAFSMKEDYKFHFSLYENDSKDGTKKILEETDWPDFLGEVKVTSEDIQTESFGSVISNQRIQNIASARNKCLNQFKKLQDMDYIVFADVDYAWSNGVLEGLFKELTENDLDILSGYSLHADIKKAHMELYDKWATRAKPTHCWWSCTPYDMLNRLVPVHSTFNGLAIYKAEPFKEGVRFESSSANYPEDVEHISVCEGFRKMGFEKIYMLKEAHLLHFSNTENFPVWLESHIAKIKNEQTQET